MRRRPCVWCARHSQPPLSDLYLLRSSFLKYEVQKALNRQLVLLKAAVILQSPGVESILGLARCLLKLQLRKLANFMGVIHVCHQPDGSAAESNPLAAHTCA